MRLISGQEQKKMDASFMKSGIPITLLMEAAGRGLAEAVPELVKAPARVDFYIGPGMNGGDLYAAARVLQADEPLYTMRKAAAACGIPMTAFTAQPESPDIPALAVDGIMGTGFDPERTLSPELEAAFSGLDEAQQQGALVLACDLPSGISADLGIVHPAAVKADATVTFVWPKTGQMQSPACQYNGRLIVKRLNLPDALIKGFSDYGLGGTSYFAVTGENFARALPALLSDSHKGNQGHALLIAGRKGMSGACRLSGEACLRSGAGLVTIVCSRDSYPEVFAALPSALYSLPEDEGQDALIEAARAVKEKADAVLAGPGLGINEATSALLDELLSWPVPLILDADMLSVLASREDGTELLKKRQAAGFETLLTPHGGEAKRLAAALPDPELLKTWDKMPRLTRVKKLAESYGAHVLLKGEASLLCEAGCRTIYTNTSGGPALAKGGSGDILAGLICGLAAEGIGLAQATCLGMYWHGAAGDLAAETLSPRTALPTDTLRALTAVLRS